MAVSFLVGLSLKARPVISLIGAVLGGVSYLVYLLCPTIQLGFLAGTLVLALLAEIFARICKIPASLILILGIYPFVPGSGIYQAVLSAVRGAYGQALKQGGDALICIALMAVSIAFVTVTFRILFGRGTKITRKRLNS